MYGLMKSRRLFLRSGFSGFRVNQDEIFVGRKDGSKWKKHTLDMSHRVEVDTLDKV
ncbi:hypothetical protein CHS0354_033580 [Potamilus streckersoni]|uniref:Uncharacterized protein n=1 Tax=Potamilus streckersoni TaxID=2493646 RepID=A0AAE0T0H9_9BIVA|nr:hypothetical protein CHS0354_033580 [Potamilus streckersoni]